MTWTPATRVRGLVPVSTLAVLVGSSGVAMAADSILVHFDPSGAIAVDTGYLKVVGDERRIAGWVGLGSADQLSMTDAISEALFTATTIEQVAASLVDRNGPCRATRSIPSNSL